MAAMATVWTPELGMASLRCCRCYCPSAPRPSPLPSAKFPTSFSSSSSVSFTGFSLGLGKWKEGLERKMWRTQTPGYAWQRKKGAVTLQPRALGVSSVGQKPYTAVMIVPTGTGATIGGFAGDALPVARALASVVDCLITHPNVLNGAMLYWPMPNTLYVEGFALDRFAEGAWGLQPVHQNRVGLVLDAGIEEELQLRHLQVADAARATLGLPVLEYTVTDTPLQVEKWIDDATGTSTGRVGRPDSLLRAVDTLIKRAQVDAVAVVGRFPDDSVDELQDYRQGQGVDVLAGVEAVISHMVVKEFQIPCAHAPALSPLPFDPSISPRSAAEEIGYTFLPCVLAGLSRAPQLVRKRDRGGAGTLWADDVDCVVVPSDACGGNGTLALCHKTGRKPLLIAVEENETVLDDTPEKLQLNNLRVANYWEALGVIAAHKAGVNPHALRRNGVNHLHRIEGPLLSETSLGSLKRLQATQLVMSGVHSN
ncbi:unnamed protein product [Sphagnum troendelagicum]|uniref:Lipoprotein n=1 Tax=Sphagnum troendelagicum TaxID=128251 RepID=A0ABP0TJS2_9BRYO